MCSLLKTELLKFLQKTCNMNFNTQILQAEIQYFIQENITSDISKIALKKSPFKGVSSSELAEQISGKIKCKNKLPKWFATQGIYFPPKLVIEQASSEQTALYKSGLVYGNLHY